MTSSNLIVNSVTNSNTTVQPTLTKTETETVKKPKYKFLTTEKLIGGLSALAILGISIYCAVKKTNMKTGVGRNISDATIYSSEWIKEIAKKFKIPARVDGKNLNPNDIYAYLRKPNRYYEELLEIDSRENVFKYIDKVKTNDPVIKINKEKCNYKSSMWIDDRIEDFNETSDAIEFGNIAINPKASIAEKVEMYYTKQAIIGKLKFLKAIEIPLKLLKDNPTNANEFKKFQNTIKVYLEMS